MKKSLAILLIAILSFNPTQVLATEDVSETSSVNEEHSTPSESSSTDVTSDSTTSEGEPTPSAVGDLSPALDEIIDTTTPDDNSPEITKRGDMNTEASEVTLSDDESSDEKSNKNTSDKASDVESDKKSDKNTSDKASDVESDEEESDIESDKKESDVEPDDEESDEETNDEELTEDDLKKLETKEEHVHEYVYESNGDGTHTVTCSAPFESESSDEDTKCPFESIEECSYDENNKCIYCGYEKEVEFAPSISIGIDNKSCVIGQTNPIIKLYIYQKSFNIEYAQICFANYDTNNFINVALTRGKYFDPQSDSFVPGTSNNWYACPNIDSNYSTGDYHIRSIYVRSTDGDTAHYSVESKTLEEKYKRIAITIKN